MKNNAGTEMVLKVLCLEDNLKDAELLKEMLVNTDYPVNFDHATGEQDYVSFLKGTNYDIVISDYSLPGFNAPAALEMALELQPGIPFICVSGGIGEDQAVELLKQGATDYVLKDRLGRLPFAVERALEGVEHRKEKDKANAELNKYHEHLEELVKARTAELNMKNEALGDAIAKLQETQRQLVVSEKIAVLRHLVSGIAHEINNPLGAIDSSRELIEKSIKQLVSNITRIFQWINGPDGEILADLMNIASAGAVGCITMSSRERRHSRAMLADILSVNDISNSEQVAAMLVEINICKDIERLLPLLRHSDILEKLHIVGCIMDSYIASNTIRIGVCKASKVVNALTSYICKDGNWQNKVSSNILAGMDEVLLLFYNTFKYFVDLEVDIEENLPHVMCFPDQLNQVWTNIIQNAIYAMQNSGKLIIQMKSQDEGILVKFIDEGCGMTPEVQARIFEPLFTTKPVGEGLGLGMDIVRMIIVERHNGRIDIESVPDKGTTVSVWLPVE